MTVRDVEIYDLPVLDDIHSQHDFPCPSRLNLIAEKVVCSKDKIVGYGQIKLLAEATIILDKNQTIRERITALIDFMEEAQQAAYEYNLEQIHVFVEDNRFANLLIEKFGFSQATGRALVKNLG